MLHSSRFETDAEACKLVQRALYVEPPARPIDLSTVPMNGSEYIHLQRLLDSNLTYAQFPNEVIDSALPESHYEMKIYRERNSREFRKYTTRLKKEKTILKIKFPKKIWSRKNEKQWCAFCLGFEIYSIIYDTQILGPDSGEAHSPLLSIVLHLNQGEIRLLLKYHYQWFKKIGMIDSIGEWVYALLACLEDPDCDGAAEILKDFHTSLKAYYITCSKSERCQVDLILSILEIISNLE